MKKELHQIILIPARFIEKIGEQYIIRCYVDKNDVQDRKFESYALEGMINPNLLMIGIMTGVGYTQANFTQVDEFQKLFEKHWKEVL